MIGILVLLAVILLSIAVITAITLKLKRQQSQQKYVLCSGTLLLVNFIF
jgi:hypothetical protein